MKINAEIHQPLADLLSNTSSILITDFCFKCTLNKQTYFKSYSPSAVTCPVASCIPLLDTNVFHRQRVKTVEAKLLQFTNWEKHFQTFQIFHTDPARPGWLHSWHAHTGTELTRNQGTRGTNAPDPTANPGAAPTNTSIPGTIHWSHSVLSLLYRRA